LASLRGLVRHLQPDHNPLRRRIDRVQTRLIATLGVLFVIIAPIAATTTAHMVARAGVRAEHLQAQTRHRVDAVVLDTPSTASGSGFGGTTRVLWHDTAGTAHVSVAPSSGLDRHGVHRAIWIDQKGHLTTHPRRHSQTIADTVMAALTVVVLLCLLHSVACTLIDRRLERRRLAQWEREWSAVAPRWTGRLP
jgi:hypothetical protein